MIAKAASTFGLSLFAACAKARPADALLIRTAKVISTRRGAYYRS